MRPTPSTPLWTAILVVSCTVMAAGYVWYTFDSRAEFVKLHEGMAPVAQISAAPAGALAQPTLEKFVTEFAIVASKRCLDSGKEVLL